MDVYDLSLRNDPRILAANFEYQSAEELIPQAKAQLKPFIYAEAGHRETRQDITSTDNDVFAVGATDFPTQTYGITLKQPIYRHASWANLRQAKAEVKKALAERSNADQELLLRVSELYLGVLAAKDDVILSQRELEAVTQQLKLTQTRRASGLATRSDIYDAEARFSTVEAKEIEARNRLDNAHHALMQSTGELRTDLSPLREEIPLLNPNPMRIEEWVQSALDSNFSLAALRHATEIAEHEAAKQKGARYPSVEFVARFDNRDTDGSLFGGGSEVETADYSIQINVPLYQGGGPSSKIRQAFAQLNRAKQELIFEQSEVTRAARAAYLGTISAIEKVKALANSVKAQESAVQAKENGYRSGLNTTLDVLDAQAILFFIRRDYAQAR